MLHIMVSLPVVQKSRWVVPVARLLSDDEVSDFAPADRPAGRSGSLAAQNVSNIASGS